MATAIHRVSPCPSHIWKVPLTRIGHLIAAKNYSAGPATPVFNPATGEQTAEVATGGPNEIDRAVAAAAAAFPAWAATTPARCAKVM